MNTRGGFCDGLSRRDFLQVGAIGSLGLTLDQVIERAATNPANTFGFPQGLGTLREGAEADVAVFHLAEGDFEFVDSLGAKRRGHRKLMPVGTVKAGKIYGSASIPVVTMG